MTEKYEKNTFAGTELGQRRYQTFVERNDIWLKTRPLSLALQGSTILAIPAIWMRQSRYKTRLSYKLSIYCSLFIGVFKLGNTCFMNAAVYLRNFLFILSIVFGHLSFLRIWILKIIFIYWKVRKNVLYSYSSITFFRDIKRK